MNWDFSTYVRPDGARKCRVCARLKARKRPSEKLWLGSGYHSRRA